MPVAERHARVTLSDLLRFGELTKNEIRVLLYLKMCLNAKSGRCNPSRSTIGEGTGLRHRSHVTEAIAGLKFKQIISEDEDGFLFLNLEQSVPESGTENDVPESGTFPKLEQVVPDSARFVPESGTGRNIDSFEHKKTVNLTTVTPKRRDGATTDIQKVFDFYLKIHEKTDRFTLTEKRKKAIAARLKTKSIADVFDAIQGCKISPHHQGVNTTRTTYDDIELICRTDDHLERFIEIYERREQFAAGKRAGETFAAGTSDDPLIDADEPLGTPAMPLRPAPDLPAAVAAVWTNTKAALTKRLGLDVVRHWFEPVAFDGLDKAGRRFLLRAGQTTHDWINLYYAEPLDECLVSGGLDGFKVTWEIEDEQPKFAAAI